MAEKVQKNMELLIREIEDFRASELFDEHECKELVKKRREHEYKVNSVTKDLDYYVEYVEYETAILRLLTLRLRRKGILKRNSTVFNILHRIKDLYERAICRFSNDFDLVLKYLKFSKEQHFKRGSASAVSLLLANFPHNVKSWCIASRFVAVDENDPKKGLQHLHKGLAIHKNSKELYKTLFEIEIIGSVGNNYSNEEAEHNEAYDKLHLMCIEKLSILLEVLFEEVDDHQMYIEILDSLIKYNFTLPIQERIMSYLQENHFEKVTLGKVVALEEEKGQIKKSRKDL